MPAILVCPQCESEHGDDERFCPRCGMPLVHRGPAEAAPSERQRRARKIKPEYTQGPLVRVTRARNQPEAEFLAGMLLEEGIPTLLRRSPAFDVPDFMASGPRELLVPESALAAARDVLLEEDSPPVARPRPSGRLRAAHLLVAALFALALLATVLFMATHVWD
jgi:zinc-ribbon domain